MFPSRFVVASYTKYVGVWCLRRRTGGIDRRKTHGERGNYEEDLV